MIYGIGCDIVDIHRFEKYVDDKKRLEKLYTENELNEFYKITNHRRKMEFLAGRFAVKEATSFPVNPDFVLTFLYLSYVLFTLN